MFTKDEINSYVLSKELDKNQKIERFEIAWDIWENFDTIRFEIRKEIFNKLYKRLIKEFSNIYKIVEKGLLKGERFGTVKIYKENWVLNKSNEKILSYAIESQKNNIQHIIFGITNPFEATNNKIEEKLSPELITKLNKIYETVNQGAIKKWNVSEYWIICKNFEKYSLKFDNIDFYRNYIENPDNIVNYYFKEIRLLIKETTNLLDEFINLYKEKL